MSGTPDFHDAFTPHSSLITPHYRFTGFTATPSALMR